MLDVYFHKPGVSDDELLDKASRRTLRSVIKAHGGPPFATEDNYWNFFTPGGAHIQLFAGENQGALLGLPGDASYHHATLMHDMMLAMDWVVIIPDRRLRVLSTQDTTLPDALELAGEDFEKVDDGELQVVTSPEDVANALVPSLEDWFAFRHPILEGQA
ncbi:MAG TPA: hypothetical protein VGO52_07735 [Hyphomonadaceae bacterium]|jgi:hypothetical protein|nr:hypothetical protein [Hyphomonadaceae bacterium]